MGERIRALWERLKDDFHRNPGLWIGVGISAAILVIAYLAYRQSHGQGSVPANGYGYPDYGTANGGSDGGGSSGYTPYQPPSLIPPIPPSGGYTSPGVAYPSYPSYGSSGALPFILPAGVASGNAADTGAGYVVQGSIQNPLAATQLAHTSDSPLALTPTSALPLMASVQTSGLTAQNQQDHTGDGATAVAVAASALPAIPVTVAGSGLTAQNQQAHTGKSSTSSKSSQPVYSSYSSSVPAYVTQKGRVA